MTRFSGKGKRSPTGWTPFTSKPKTTVLFAATLIALVILVIASGLFVLRMEQYNATLSARLEPVPPADNRMPVDAIPPFEVFPEEEFPEILPEPIPDVRPKDPIPKIAILIDDLGYDRLRAIAFIKLGVPLTFSILPHSPFQKEIAEAALSAGNEIILHLPLEPDEYPMVDPGPGTLLMSMNPEEFTRQLMANLEAVPGIQGVNSHMGSRLTKDQNRMIALLSILKGRDLFFVDSRTTANSTARQAAKDMGLEFSQRDVFLDHVSTEEFIQKQIGILLVRAKKKGSAIGIGHPNKTTLRVLQSQLPLLQKQATLVPVSSIVKLQSKDVKNPKTGL